MNQLVTTQNDFTSQMIELDKIQDTCKKLMATKHYAKLGEGGIHAIISRAKALGIHPFEALNGGFYCISGKIGMSTEMMVALVRQRGHSITKDEKSNNECVILHGKRADNGDTWTCKFTKEDAIIAGLWNGQVWKKYPAIMLYNRCMSMLFRQLFADISLGAGYCEDELKEIKKVDEYSLPVSPCVVTNLKQENVEQPPALIENVPKTINEIQWNDLKILVNQCMPTFQTNFWEGLKKWEIHCDEDFIKLTEENYLKLKLAATVNVSKKLKAEAENENNSAQTKIA